MAVFEKMSIKRQIRALSNRILFMEKKRERSQSALVQAILTGSSPHDDDVDYFNRYTREINETRDGIHVLQKRLDELSIKSK